MNTFGVFSEMTGSVYSLSRLSVKYVSLNIHSLSVVLSSKVFCEKKWLDQLGTKTVMNVFL
jgi:hypothetical protein